MVARIVLDQFARREMVLEVNNHADISCAGGALVLARLRLSVRLS
jgi:hypothetical protein